LSEAGFDGTTVKEILAEGSDPDRLLGD